MNTSLPVMQSLWVGGQLSNLEILCLKSFVDHGHPFHLYTYNDLGNMPPGVVQKDAREILPESSIFKYANRDSYAGFANLFRYKLLLDKGGIWTDMDIVCLRPFDIPNEYVFTVEPPGNITNFFIQVPMGSELMQTCYTKAAKYDSSRILWGQTGPQFLAKIVGSMNIDAIVLETEYFGAIPYDWHLVFTEDDSAFLLNTLLKDSFGTHLWNEMWRINEIDKNKIFSPTSIYGALQARHGLV